MLTFINTFDTLPSRHYSENGFKEVLLFPFYRGGKQSKKLRNQPTIAQLRKKGSQDKNAGILAPRPMLLHVKKKRLTH